jgi:hypothetical protein
MALALETLRGWRGHVAIEGAHDALRLADGAALDIGHAVRRELLHAYDLAEIRRPDWVACRARLLRARLALFLRAVLRADRGDVGRRRYEPTGRTCRRVDHASLDGRCRVPSCGCYTWHRRITPLWERAAAHGGEHA